MGEEACRDIRKECASKDIIRTSQISIFKSTVQEHERGKSQAICEVIYPYNTNHHFFVIPVNDR